MNTIIDIIALRKPRLEYTSPPICGLIFSGSSSGTFVIVSDNIAPTRAGIAAPSNPAITQSPTHAGCTLVSFKAPRGQLGFLIYEETSPGSGQFALISNTIPPGAIGVLTPGNYFTAPVDQFGVEGSHSGPTVVPGGQYVPVPIVTSPTAISYNVYNGTTLVWSGVDPTRDAFEGCNCANYEVQALSLEGTALSAPVFACTPAQLAVAPTTNNILNQPLLSSGTATYVLTNVGPVSVIGAASLSLTDCVITSGMTYNLAPGQSINVVVTFTPQSLENLTGTLSFSGAQPLYATLNVTSKCANTSPYAPTDISAVDGGGAEQLVYDPINHYSWFTSFVGTIVAIDNRTGNIVQNLGTGFGAVPLDIQYNPKIGTKGGLAIVYAQSRSPGPAQVPVVQAFDLSSFTFGPVITIPLAVYQSSIGYFAVRPSDGSMLFVSTGTNSGYTGNWCYLDKNFNLLNNGNTAVSFGGVCYSKRMDRFLVASQSAGSDYYIFNPNNPGAGFTGSVLTGIGGNRIFELQDGSGVVMISGTGAWALIDPVANTLLSSANSGMLNGSGVAYSSCDGTNYFAGVGVGLYKIASSYSGGTPFSANGGLGVNFDPLVNLKITVDRGARKVYYF